MNNKKGFTLIELLVVVAIIGVLATIALSSLSDARAKAKDAGRIAFARELQSALEMYYLDNGEYPPTVGFISATSSASFRPAMKEYIDVTRLEDTHENRYMYYRKDTACYQRGWISESKESYGIYLRLDSSQDVSNNLSPYDTCRLGSFGMNYVFHN